MSGLICPLCGAGMTQFADPLSDDMAILPFDWQRCSECDLPCELWGEVTELKAENAKLRAAGRKLLMVTLPPHDVSGRAMYDEAKQVIHGN